MDEWFSHRPIAKLPGENVADSELPDITDHLTAVVGPNPVR